jgi:hypothetical protein
VTEYRTRVLTGPRILTAWDQDTDDDEEYDVSEFDFGMGIWMSAIMPNFGGRPRKCHACNGPIATHEALAAMVVRPYEDEDILMRFVCRCCAPDETRARVMAAALLPEVMGGAA